MERGPSEKNEFMPLNQFDKKHLEEAEKDYGAVGRILSVSCGTCLDVLERGNLKGSAPPLTLFLWK